MIDASKPLSLLNQEVLKRLCTVSFTHNSLLYVALNKVDLVGTENTVATVFQQDFGTDLENKDITVKIDKFIVIRSEGVGE